MAIPFDYNLRSLFYRKTATILTIIAVALTVAVLLVLLGTAQGFRSAVVETGRTDNVICLRTGAGSEGESTITRADASTLRGLPGIATGPTGQPLAAGEMYAAISLEREGGGSTNVPLRGVAPESFLIRDQVRIIEGRQPRPGARELAVGQRLVGAIRGCRLGGAVRVSKEPWEVVGVLDGGGTAFDSEMWGDVELLLQVFDRTFYNTVAFRVAPDAEVGNAAEYEGSGDKRTVSRAGSGVLGNITERIGTVKVMSERDYFASQAGFLGGTLIAMATFLTLLMSAGALAGCTNTLLAAVAGRTREIGGLLAIGYRPWQIFVGFLAEALALTLLGGAVGILLTLPADGIQTSTTNWQTFTEQAFALRIDGVAIATALALAAAVGIVGGVLPAWRASRLKPVDALRRG